MGETLVWRALTGEVHVTADGSDWPGCPSAMAVDYAIFHEGPGGFPTERWGKPWKNHGNIAIYINLINQENM